jgi:hypothetical protein
LAAPSRYIAKFVPVPQALLDFSFIVSKSFATWIFNYIVSSPSLYDISP